ncbi:hypothetical protein ZIOFF_004639 [Zingiber officinale]|uniref:Uncharacterized protein n=1 Tax=Zingiber officinale TaxID=94328 RepID=A0A8J5LUF2_ZINOF|nr:hypothetical protein ZIOFF_004639 [Zingiber officinale]
MEVGPEAHMRIHSSDCISPLSIENHREQTPPRLSTQVLPPSKADLAKKQKVVEDKTFGLKNKNKSKNDQRYVQNLQQAVQPKADPSKITVKPKKKVEEKDREKEFDDLFRIAVSQPKVPVSMVFSHAAAHFTLTIPSTINQEEFAILSVDPKSIMCEFYKIGQCQKGFKCKFSHDLNVQRKGEKIDLYSCTTISVMKARHDLETMEDWDQKTLEKVVETKNKEYNQNKPTDIMAQETGHSLAELRFMELALEQARLALEKLEVPVGLFPLYVQATRHAEMEAIDTLLAEWQKIGCQLEVADRLSKCDLYVTCEPCIMCATALSILGIRKVFYGCANDKFGGCGSILSLHEITEKLPRGQKELAKLITEGALPAKGFECKGGVMADEAVALFRCFYEQGNPNAGAGQTSNVGCRVGCFAASTWTRVLAVVRGWEWFGLP